jgi:hypothetical protein
LVGATPDPLQAVPSAFSCLFRPSEDQGRAARERSGIQVFTRAMHDPVEIRRRVDRVLTRVDRRDDYR